MSSKIKIRRSTTTGAVPPLDPTAEGELFLNFPDRRLGFSDAAGNSQNLIPVRWHSEFCDYAIDDLVEWGGTIVRCIAAHAAKPYDPVDWESAVGSVEIGGRAWDQANNPNYELGDVVTYDNVTYRCIVKPTDIFFIPGEWVSLEGSAGMTWVNTAVDTPAVNLFGYFVDLTAGPVTLTLPPTPVIGETVAFADHLGQAALNNLTIAANGNNIMGDPADMIVETEYAGGTLVFNDAITGWVVADGKLGNDTSAGVDFATAAEVQAGTVTDKPIAPDVAASDLFRVDSLSGPQEVNTPSTFFANVSFSGNNTGFYHDNTEINVPNGGILQGGDLTAPNILTIDNAVIDGGTF